MNWFRRIKDSVAVLQGAKAIGSQLSIGGYMDFEYQRPSGLWVKDRSQAMLCEWAKDHAKNGVATIGINNLLDRGFGNATQITAFYFGLVGSSGFSAFNAADTMGSHAGWTEITNYAETTRVVWGVNAAAGGVITSSGQATFTASTSMGVQGALLSSGSVKGAGTGTLWATAPLTVAPQTIPTGLVLRIQYTLTLTAS